MSEFFLELFSEEIPSNLQKNLRENLLKSFNEFFLEKSIKDLKHLKHIKLGTFLTKATMSKHLIVKCTCSLLDSRF